MACISLCWPNGTRTDSGIGGNAPILRTRVCLSEEPIHDGCAGLDDGPDLVPVDQLDDVVSLCPTSREMSSRETPASDSSETNERRSSRGVQSAGSSRGTRRRRGADRDGRRRRPCPCPRWSRTRGQSRSTAPRREPVLCLLHPLGAKV